MKIIELKREDDSRICIIYYRKTTYEDRNHFYTFMIVIFANYV